ncbi:hypothetical protein ACX27_18560 [Nostoc piscinale CENA21]|uniref:Uncharacterized protein n=1 Tax=Nostoc piscinale CENA21 TaxID=224013 RepID=A0A0M3V5W6_9NOSO|nr:hypothetical protein [Nostoc piscinale]ALF54387.1 hypothetical protein ACX27_18560 [Nostoc piscinale CENA21]
MDNIQDIFNKWFARWQITLPDKNLQERQKGSIFQAGWSINFIFGIENNLEYLEFYAIHRMTNDSHTVIYENGEIKHLECLNPPLEYSSPIDENQREHNKKNRKVKEELIDKSLL